MVSYRKKYYIFNETTVVVVVIVAVVVVAVVFCACLFSCISKKASTWCWLASKCGQTKIVSLWTVLIMGKRWKTLLCTERTA